MTTAKASRRALNPAALAERLDVHEWQVHRAESDGLLPARDRSVGWSANRADEIAAMVAADRSRFLASVGSVPNLGAWDAAKYLARRLGRADSDVWAETVRELYHLGHLTGRGWNRDYQIYCGRSIEAFAARPDAVAVLAAAKVSGETLMASQAADRLHIRRVDFDHAVRAGLIKPVDHKLTGHRSKRRDPGMLLYRAGDVNDLAAREDIDWAAVRAATKGKQSPLAKLPDAVKGATT